MLRKIGDSLYDLVVQLVLGWFIYLNRPGVRSPPLPAVGCSLWCGADDNFVLVVRMRHNRLRQLLGGSREFLAPTVKLHDAILYLLTAGCLWVCASGLALCFGSSYRSGFGLRLIVSFWLLASAHHIVLIFGFCFWAPLLLGFLLMVFVTFGLLVFFFLRFEVAFCHLVVSTFGFTIR